MINFNYSKGMVSFMKSLNKKGFTLIELLAVITIMGILMMVAIPTISRTIENSRKDTFIDTARKYADSAMNMWIADNFMCNGFSSSAVQAGTYYIRVDSSDPSQPQILEQGGKSPWGNRDIKGAIIFVVYIRDNTRNVSVFPILVDGIHGVNVNSDGSIGGTVRSAESFVRGSIVMTGANYEQFFYNGSWKYFTFTTDINGDGDRADIVDGVNENAGRSVLCVER